MIPDLPANSTTDSTVQLSPPHRRSLEDFEDIRKKPEHLKDDEGDKSEDSGIESSKNVSMESSGSPANDSDGKLSLNDI